MDLNGFSLCLSPLPPHLPTLSKNQWGKNSLKCLGEGGLTTAKTKKEPKSFISLNELEFLFVLKKKE